MSTVIDGSASVTINSGVILGITSGTAVTLTTQTSVDFTSIPSWVKRITVMFQGVSLSSTAAILIQGGNSGGFVSTGYISTSNLVGQTNNTGGSSSTSGFLFFRNTAANESSGIITLLNLTGSTWVYSHTGKNNSLLAVIGGGNVSIPTLDRIRITTSSTDTFNAGSVNILYEG